jgi:hypothetical protein
MDIEGMDMCPSDVWDDEDVRGFPSQPTVLFPSSALSEYEEFHLLGYNAL